ncbi:MAG: helix-turn-helix domain-containing protein [Candidatus Saccharimonadales bacterium]
MVNPIRKIVAKNIRNYRKELNLSQEALGFRCSMPHVYISKVESAQISIGVDNLARIAKALGVKPSELLEPEGWRKV